MINPLVVWSMKNADQCFLKHMMTCLVLSTTQRYSVYCHRELRKAENIDSENLKSEFRHFSKKKKKEKQKDYRSSN